MAKIALKLEQRTKISQIQQLTIKLLTLQSQNLTDFLNEQVAENPLLDIRYPDVRPAGSRAAEKPIDNLKSRGDSLETGLLKQLRVQPLPKKILLAAGLVIRSLDEKGFFSGNLDRLGQDYALSLAEMEEGLSVVQRMDPPGIGARSLCECLLLQTHHKGHVPPQTEELLREHYQDFLQGHWQKLEKEMGLTPSGLQVIRAFLKTLSLQPAGQASEETEFVRPDIEVYEDEKGKLAVRSLEELPQVFFRDDLYQEYAAQGDKKTQTYIHKARRKYLDLQTALAYRWQSILTVMDYILARQEGWFRQQTPLQSLLQKDIAADTGLSTATVSRVCRSRYLLFEGQIYAVKYFFSRGYDCGPAGDGSVSAKAVQEKMTALIAAEDKAHPYSDQELTDRLAAEHIYIARRTVAKFRRQLGIPKSCIRRQLKNSLIR